MKKRKIPSRKDIPDWRDPDMPVIDDGVLKTPERFQAERIRSFIASNSSMGNRLMPDWKHDPTYFGRKKHD